VLYVPNVVRNFRITSLVLKTLHTAIVSQWMETLYIPVDLLNKMALWLVAQQDNSTGAFIESADNYYDRSFWVSSLPFFDSCHREFFKNILKMNTRLLKRTGYTFQTEYC
jgi:hypothetical protein